jgi:hypothetical protein
VRRRWRNIAADLHAQFAATFVLGDSYPAVQRLWPNGAIDPKKPVRC